jgi:DNA-binding PadR family transcriptional regulator
MTVKHSLLALLAEEPGTGYALKQRYEERSGELWAVNIGQVYKTLARLEEGGLVLHDGAEGGGVYRLTEAGERDLTGWLSEPVDVAGPRDELVVKVLLGLGTPGVDARQLVQHHRRALVEQAQRLTRMRGGDDLTWALLVDSLVLRLDAAMRWLDRCEDRLGARAGTER